MMVMVLSRAAPRRLSLPVAPAGIAARPDFAIETIVLLAVAGSRAQRIARGLGRDDGDRLAAERIVDEGRPQHHHDADHRQRAGQQLRQGEGQFRQPALLLGLVEGAFRSSRFHGDVRCEIVRFIACTRGFTAGERPQRTRRPVKAALPDV